MAEINDKIVEIIESVLGNSLSQKEGLMDLGILDSLMTMQVIEEIENYYDIKLQEEDFTHENFNSVNAIGSMVKRYLDNQ